MTDTCAVKAAVCIQCAGPRRCVDRNREQHCGEPAPIIAQLIANIRTAEPPATRAPALTDGYTRINLELARSLMALRRYPEAIAILQPALRGGVDGSNTYVTHTELHEAIAQAFAAAGQRDSAAVHYAAVERAWRSADPQFTERYRIARTYAGSSQ